MKNQPLNRILFFIPFLMICCLIACQETTSSSEENNTAITENKPSKESQKIVDSMTNQVKIKPGLLSNFDAHECPSHVEKEFNCACFFSTVDYYKGQSIFASDFDQNACVKVNGELNALYPDWEGRDYKKELKKLSTVEYWISVNGDLILYFGKPLKDYKYNDAVEFLTDVILASGKDIEDIPFKTINGNPIVDKIMTQTKMAIIKAKAIKEKGGNDPLSIQKYDNRSYDVFIRTRQITQFEGEANRYEGKIVLLKNRGRDILETKKIKGNCGC